MKIECFAHSKLHRQEVLIFMKNFITSHQRNIELTILFLCLFLLIACTFFIQSVQQNMWQSASRDLQTLTRKSAQFFQYRLDFEQQSLEEFAQFLTPDTSPDEKRFERFARRHGLNRLFIAGNDASTARFAPQTSVSAPYADASGDSVVLLRTPLSDTQSLYAECPLRTFFTNHAADFYGQKAAAALIDAEGNFLLPPQNATGTSNISAWIQSEEANSAFAQMRLGLQGRRAGLLLTKHNAEEIVLSYAPVGDGRWYALFILPRTVLQQDERRIILYALSVTALILLCTLFISWLIARNMRAYNQKLLEVAYRDPVTGANNFLKCKLDIEQLLAEYPLINHAIVYSDIRNFKYVNDVHGFAAGDKILRHYAQCLEQSEQNETFGRVNGDTFLSVIRYQDRQEIPRYCRTLADRVSDISSVVPGAGNLHIYIGVYCNEIGAFDISIEKMIDRANLAHHHAKKNPTLPCVIYTDNLRQTMLTEQALENHMEQALQQGEFEVYLQPKYDIRESRVSAAEALVRWNHPEKGLIPPGSFIPLFERNGFIRKLDAYVFEAVCKLLRRWSDAGLPLLPISVNVSRAQLHSNRFLSDYIRLKSAYGVPDHFIEIEFTESLAFGANERMHKVLQHFRAHGFSCSIDDFGAGYSSLNLLKDLPVDILKLDKRFFDKSPHPEREEIIVESVVAMAKRLRIRTVAEGVEEWAQVDFLKNIGCDFVQGYVFDRPLPIRIFEQKYMRDETAAIQASP